MLQGFDGDCGSDDKISEIVGHSYFGDWTSKENLKSYDAVVKKAIEREQVSFHHQGVLI